MFPGHWSAFTDRCVKYIANRPAKNISSLASQTIVPTDTGFGLSTWMRGATAAGDDTQPLCLPAPHFSRANGPKVPRSGKMAQT